MTTNCYLRHTSPSSEPVAEARPAQAVGDASATARIAAAPVVHLATHQNLKWEF